MKIKEFEYLETAITELNSKYIDLNVASTLLEEAFTDILQKSSLDFNNINCRVKSEKSLREKILRNRYYKKYPDANSLIYNLSDLIGIRVECKFGDDERKIYRFLKKYFNKQIDTDYYCSEFNENIHLKLSGKQPQKQKNGFTIYRLDGKFVFYDITIPFELQIKSLVNMFWGEIEHQIIYKNSSYVMEDKFLKDLMNSIKHSLSMIDKQLLTVLNYVESRKPVETHDRTEHLETIISKLIYDLFTKKMSDSIDIVVDFKASCETIVRYTFFDELSLENNKKSDILIKALTRLNEISDENVSFNSALTLERSPNYKNKFTKILGNYFINAMNNEFNWNLFFTILFTLEPLDNISDFEKFLNFIHVSYTDSKFINNQRLILHDIFGSHFNEIDESIKTQVAETLISIDKINIVYSPLISEVTDALEYTYKYIVDNVDSIESWKLNSNSILSKLNNEILDSV